MAHLGSINRIWAVVRLQCGMASGLRFIKHQFLVVAIAVVLVLLLASCYYYDPYLPSDGSVVRPYLHDTSSRNCSAVPTWVVTTSGAIKPTEAVHVILNSADPAKNSYGSIVVMICDYRLNSKKFVHDDCTCFVRFTQASYKRRGFNKSRL